MRHVSSSASLASSPARLLAGLALLATLTCAVSVQAQVALPDFGDPSSATMSSGEERALGEAFMREVRARLPLVEDPEVNGYIQSLGYRIASQSERQRAFTFFVVDEPVINAFAAPGGYIGIYRGLILASESEGELASVLAHETAHVTQNHLARSFERAGRVNIAAMAGLVAALILGSQNPQAGQAAAAAVAGASVQSRLDFSRSNEQEADRVGMQLLVKADLDPRAMPAFFERLQESIRYSRRPPEYLSTHPVTASRIADTRARAEQYPYRQYEDSLAYHLVRAKLTVAAETDARTAVRFYEDRLASGLFRNEAAERYGLALAQTRTGRHEDARAGLTALAAEAPDNLFYQSALARVALASGDMARSLAIYKDALTLYPDDRAMTRGYAEALLQAGSPMEAERLLETFARRNALGADLYRLLALAYEQNGKRGESLLALAEQAYLLGRLDVAIHHLEQAQRLPGLDFYVASRVDARLGDLRAERAEIAQR